MNKIYFIILSTIVLLYVINIVRKGKFSIKESFWWFLGAVVMLILSIFPQIIDWFAKKINIAYPPSLLFVLCIVFLLFQNFRASKKISEMQLKIIELAQQLSLIREKVNNEKKSK